MLKSSDYEEKTVPTIRKKKISTAQQNLKINTSRHTEHAATSAEFLQQFPIAPIR